MSDTNETAEPQQPEKSYEYLNGFWHGRLDGLNFSQTTLTQLLTSLMQISTACKIQGLSLPHDFDAQYRLLERYLNVIQQERQRYIEEEKP
jgi:hypothetical protein